MLAADVSYIGPAHAVTAAPVRVDGIRCRQIATGDLSAVANLLCEGFPRRGRPYWIAALQRLDAHQVPDGFPRYGFMLETGGAAVGVLLLISATIPAAERDVIRSNLSSWYVRPEFRMYASMLVSRALKLSPDTFVNVSPAESTWPTIEAQGFARFSAGACAAIPLLGSPFARAAVRAIDEAGADELGVTPGELRLLRDHRAHGCLSLCGVSAGRGHPFVFRRRVLKRFPLPCAQLIYCRDASDLPRFAGSIGRHLARRGMGWMIVSAGDSIPGLVGEYFVARHPMYWAGKIRPRPGDLAYTEAALFGL